MKHVEKNSRKEKKSDFSFIRKVTKEM